MNASTLRKRNKRQKGECTWCGKPVGKGRRRWCSQICVDDFRATYDWQWIRGLVHDRDRGVCSKCGCDCDKITALLNRVRYRNGGDGYETFRYLLGFYIRIRFDNRSIGDDWWQADHIKPRVEGGTNELDNLRTLCIPCHKVETAALAAKRAAKRRAAG